MSAMISALCAHAIVGFDAERLEQSRVLLENPSVVHANGVPEHDGIGDLHHGGLQVQRQQHALIFRLLCLAFVKGLQRATSHYGGVKHLAFLKGN
jgi:hypothetical protein